MLTPVSTVRLVSVRRSVPARWWGYFRELESAAVLSTTARFCEEKEARAWRLATSRSFRMVHFADVDSEDAWNRLPAGRQSLLRRPGPCFVVMPRHWPRSRALMSPAFGAETWPTPFVMEITAVEEIVYDAARAIGAGVATVVNLLCPDVVVMGGGLVEAMPDIFVDFALKVARKRVMPAFSPLVYDGRGQAGRRRGGDRICSLGQVHRDRKVAAG